MIYGRLLLFSIFHKQKIKKKLIKSSQSSQLKKKGHQYFFKLIINMKRKQTISASSIRPKKWVHKKIKGFNMKLFHASGPVWGKKSFSFYLQIVKSFFSQCPALNFHNENALFSPHKFIKKKKNSFAKRLFWFFSVSHSSKDCEKREKKKIF